MMLLTKEIRKKLPKLHETEGQGDDAIVVVKFFDPCGSWTWYAVEGEPILDEDENERSTSNSTGWSKVSATNLATSI